MRPRVVVDPLGGAACLLSPPGPGARRPGTVRGRSRRTRTTSPHGPRTCAPSSDGDWPASSRGSGRPLLRRGRRPHRRRRRSQCATRWSGRPLRGQVEHVAGDPVGATPGSGSPSATKVVDERGCRALRAVEHIGQQLIGEGVRVAEALHGVVRGCVHDFGMRLGVGLPHDCRRVPSTGGVRSGHRAPVSSGTRCGAGPAPRSRASFPLACIELAHSALIPDNRSLLTIRYATFWLHVKVRCATWAMRNIHGRTSP